MDKTSATAKKKPGILAKGAEITTGDLRRLCCDADLMPAVLGGQSEILDVGRTQRLVTPAIRKALTLRDGGCIFPNCTAPDTACEAHHIHPWWADGATTLTNMVLASDAEADPPRKRTPPSL